MLEPTKNEKILIVGASVRSAAQSMVTAGFQPVCVDLFGDLDLREIADVHVIKDYPAGFVDVAKTIHRQYGRLPFMYTGGLENFPQTIDSLTKQHDLAGNAGDSLRTVRDPGQLSDCFFKANIPHPTVRIGPNAELLANPNENWMKKPIHGSAGFGISRWNGEKLSPDCFLQQHISGSSVAVLFVASDGAAQLIGTTLQLVGCKSLSGGRFGWCGSFGPIPLNDHFELQAKSIGNAVASQFELTGLFGVDCVVNGDFLFPIEVNPRYTGSVEVLERATGWQSILHHLQACRSDINSAEKKRSNPLFAPMDRKAKIGHCGKAILFAPHSLTVKTLSTDDKTIADVPMDGTKIEAGNPICSVMGIGETAAECINDWSANVGRISEQLFDQEVGFEQEIRDLWQQVCRTGLID